MIKVKQNGFVWTILLITFLIFIFICTLVNTQMNFFANYQNFYQKEQATAWMNGVEVEGESFRKALFEAIPEEESVTFGLPDYSDAISTQIVFPGRFERDLETINGKFFSPDDSSFSIVLGKDVLNNLNQDEQARDEITIYDQTFKIKGILSESPFNNTILINGNAAIEVPRIMANIVEISSTAATFELAAQQIEQFVDLLPNKPSYMSSIDEAYTDLGDISFYSVFQQYQTIFVELFIVVILSIGIHYYQRFDSWKLEFGIRKMVGANTLQLVRDTFIKFFLLTSSAYLSSLLVCGIGVLFFRELLPYSLNSILVAIGQVFIVYGLLLLLLFLFSLYYVRKVSVTDILVEAEG